MKRKLTRRAAMALKMLKAYPSFDKHDIRSSIVDVITDLKHLAHESGFDLWAIDETARDHYNAEVRPDHDANCPARDGNSAGPCLCEDPRAGLV